MHGWKRKCGSRRRTDSRENEEIAARGRERKDGGGRWTDCLEKKKGSRTPERYERDMLAVRCCVMMAGDQCCNSLSLYYIYTLDCAHKNTHSAEKRSW